MVVVEMVMNPAGILIDDGSPLGQSTPGQSGEMPRVEPSRREVSEQWPEMSMQYYAQQLLNRKRHFPPNIVLGLFCCRCSRKWNVKSLQQHPKKAGLLGALSAGEIFS